MIDWKLKETNYDENRIAYLGNKFLIGNGYMGVRGTLAEYEKEHLPAINLAGIYDRVGDGWREPLNAPNGFFTCIVVDGKILRLPEIPPKNHRIELDYRHGIFSRSTTWKTDRGSITVESERFVSMKNVHLGVMKYKVFADFHADVQVVYGIDADVWDINGPHYDSVEFVEDDVLGVVATTHEKHYKVAVSAGDKTNFPCEKKIGTKDKKVLKSINFVTDINASYEIDRYFSVYTSKDCGDCLYESVNDIDKSLLCGYEDAKEVHKETWEALWKDSEVVIEGDDCAMEALNYSLYHLHSIAPRHTDSLSIAARGLSGQTYKGAVFWDTEMFMLDFYSMTNPAVARSLVKYRIDSLEGAKEKAESYGYKGAFYPWESQEGGFDACSDYNVVDVFTKRPMRTFFKDKQVHISSAVVYGIRRYVDITGDKSILSEGGAVTIIECALFYYSLLLRRAGATAYEIHDVIGPDEYHERVNNNGYTNRMAKYTFEKALEILKNINDLSEGERNKINSLYDVNKLIEQFEDAAENIFIPKPDRNGIIPQFDGYLKLEDTTIDVVKSRLLDLKEYWGGAYGVASQTQIIKQADVVTWISLFSNEIDSEIQKKNLNYYEPRTEHGSSLSACMYSLLYCKCGIPDKAYPFFMKSASADIAPGGKEWAGLVYIGGTHPAAAGGAYMVAIKGFGGLQFNGDEISINPKLPKGWKKLSYKIKYRNKIYQIDITEEKSEIKEIK